MPEGTKESLSAMLHVVNEDLDFDSAPAALVKKVQKHHKNVRLIEVLNRRGQKGYVKTGRELRIITPDEVKQAEGDAGIEDGFPEELDAPEDIAMTVWTQAQQWAEVHGPGMFKFVLRDGDNKKLDEHIQSVSEGGGGAALASSGGGNERESELVETMRFLRVIAKDLHDERMEIGRHNLDLHKANLTARSSDLDAEVERVRIQGQLLNRKFDMEETKVNAEASARRWEAGVTPFTRVGDKIGEVVGDRLKFWLLWLEEQVKQHGMEPPPESYGAALRQVLEGKDLSGIEAACRACDDELWSLFEELMAADDNSVFKNLATNFKRRAVQSKLRGKNPQAIFDAATGILTEAEAKRLYILFKHTGLI